MYIMYLCIFIYIHTFHTIW